MSEKFYNVMQRRSDLLHRLAVWQEVSEHLSKFLDTDASPATMGIRTDGGGMAVPQDRIEAVLGEIDKSFLQTINNELSKIDKSEVAEHDRKEKQVRKKKNTKKKETKRTAKAKSDKD